MTMLRLLTYVFAATITAAAFIPALSGARDYLLPTGIGLLGLATRWPQDQATPPVASTPAK
jgi:hypothetical protein